jgi:hypothetical protein
MLRKLYSHSLNLAFSDDQKRGRKERWWVRGNPLPFLFFTSWDLLAFFATSPKEPSYFYFLSTCPLKFLLLLHPTPKDEDTSLFSEGIS